MDLKYSCDCVCTKFISLNPNGWDRLIYVTESQFYFLNATSQSYCNALNFSCSSSTLLDFDWLFSVPFLDQVLRT